MKKLFVLLLSCLLVLGIGSALAEGGLTTVNATLVMVPGYGDYGLFSYAEVVNNSDTSLALNMDVSYLNLLDAEGNVVYTTDVYNCFPGVLAPGQTGYVTIDGMFITSDIADQAKTYVLSLNGTECWYMDSAFALPDECLSAEIVTTDDPFDSHLLYTYLKNPGDAPLFDYDVLSAIYDQHGHLIYVAASGSYGVGIPAGESAILRTSFPDELLEYWQAHDIVPTEIKSIAYFY